MQWLCFSLSKDFSNFFSARLRPAIVILIMPPVRLEASDLDRGWTSLSSDDSIKSVCSKDECNTSVSKLLLPGVLAKDFRGDINIFWL